jgi:peroxiredoxin
MLKERGITYPVAVDAKEAIGRRYGLIAHPTTVLIDRSGKVVKAETGYVRSDEKAMEGALLALLGPQSARAEQ